MAEDSWAMVNPATVEFVKKQLGERYEKGKGEMYISQSEFLFNGLCIKWDMKARKKLEEDLDELGFWSKH